MRIDLNTSGVVSGAQIERTSASHAAQSNAGKTSSSRVVESDAKVGALTAAALDSPEIRAEKVQALKAQIEAGTYKVSAEHVAGAVLNHLRQHAG